MTRLLRMMTSKVLEIKKGIVDRLPTRGEVAAQEQMRTFGWILGIRGEPSAPQTRGEVAAQEQMRVFQQVFATKRELQAPTTRGEVAAQEQMRIIAQATGNFVQNRDSQRRGRSINHVE
jgi:hypothetical protein